MRLFLPSALAAVLIGTTVMLPPVYAESTSDLQTAKAKLTVYNITYDGQTFFGQVLNKTGKPMYRLMLYYKVTDSSGQVVEVGRALLLENELGGRQNGTFGGKTEAVGTGFAITSAEWIDLPTLRN